MKTKNKVRLKLHKKYRKYYITSKKNTVKQERKIYIKYIKILEKLIKDCNKLEKKKKLALTYTPNYRQTGAYNRCITNYPDKGWSSKLDQFRQAYKELTVDYIYYSDDIEYKEISIEELKIIKEMANFLIEKANELISIIDKSN